MRKLAQEAENRAIEFPQCEGEGTHLSYEGVLTAQPTGLQIGPSSLLLLITGR